MVLKKFNVVLKRYRIYEKFDKKWEMKKVKFVEKEVVFNYLIEEEEDLGIVLVCVSSFIC